MDVERREATALAKGFADQTAKGPECQLTSTHGRSVVDTLLSFFLPLLVLVQISFDDRRAIGWLGLFRHGHAWAMSASLSVPTNSDPEINIQFVIDGDFIGRVTTDSVRIVLDIDLHATPSGINSVRSAFDRHIAVR